jgi:hypothetical protein
VLSLLQTLLQDLLNCEDSFMKRVLTVCILMLGMILVMPFSAWAGTGKISGRVLDSNKEGIIGASVQILETKQGVAIGMDDGTYAILGVTPGVYTLRVSSIGYTAQTFTGVEVSSDQTTTLNATLSEEAIGIDERVIEYQKPNVVVDITDKRTRTTGKEFQTRAVADIGGLLKKTPGFKVDPEGALHVRGGRASEMLVQVDGVDFRDPLVNGSKQLVNLSALNVEEIEVMTGGDARYGGFQSALVNVSTPEGSTSNYSGVIEYRTDRIFKTADPYNVFADNFNGKSHKLWEASFDQDQYDYSLSGPVPLVDKWVGKQKLSFFTSGTARMHNTYTPYDVNRSANDYLGIGFNIPERQNNDYSTFWKLTYRMDPARKFNLTYQRDFSMWDIYPDGEASIDGNYGWQYKYNVANRPYAKTSRQAISLQFSHNLSKTTMYEVSLGNFYTVTKVQPRGKNPDQFTLSANAEDDNRNVVGSLDSDKNGFLDGYVDANRNGKYDGSGEGYDDVNQNGQWDRGEDWVDLNGNGVYDSAEPWVDVTNPQTGANNIGVYDSWDSYVDLNHNGRWDAAEPQLPEQDWNHNGTWDGERFQDANANGRYDGTGEGFDDKNLSGGVDKRDLYNTANQTSGEPFVDGDYWNDTGEPFQDLPDSNGYYNGMWDAGEVWWDLPSSYTGVFTPRGVPTTNGVYDAPNNAFDEYELFTVQAGAAFGMDPRYPVLYTWEPVEQGIRHGGREWLNMGLDEQGRPNYLHYIADKSTWTNATLNDGNDPIFDIPNYTWDGTNESFTDYNSNGTQDNLPDGFLRSGTWDQTAFWMHRSSQEWKTKFDLTSQVNKFHELKTGLELKYRILKMASISQPDQPYSNTDIPLPEGSPYPGRGGTRDFYEHKPWEGALYFQDKMEFEGMIVRAGLRSDFVIQDPNLREETQKQLDNSQPGALLASRGKMVIAPRLGISHPISTKSKLYFNYGHYYQTPSFEYFYRSATANLNPNTLVGNPNLDYEKTVSYEVGVNTEFTEDWVIDVAGYYRDVFNQIGTVAQRDGPLTLNRYFNLGYARARGFEFSLEKKFSNMWAVTVNYDFSYAYGKESAAADGLLQRNSGIPENRDEHPLGWDQTHTVSAYLTLMVNEKEHPKPFGVTIPNNWLSTLEFSYGSGYPYTPSTYTTGKASNLILANSARFPNTVTTDLKFDKYWKLTEKLKLTTGFEIYNLFDRRNVRSLYAATGNAHDSTHELDQTARSDGNLGTDADHNPRNYGSPRHILFHLKLAV